jgi:hypothetical protein
VELVGDEEEGCGGGEVPAVVGVGDEDECAMPDCKEELPSSDSKSREGLGYRYGEVKTYLEHDEFVKVDARPIVTEDDEEENDQTPDVVSLSPCFEESAFLRHAVPHRHISLRLW